MTTTVPPLHGRLYDERAAAAYLGVSPGTLSVWRCVRRYPLAYVKVGRSVKYRLVDLDRFIAERTVGAAE